MKFANYKYHGRNINNLGDHIQIMTIDYLYGEMGIEPSEIIYIDVNELRSYDGPPVLLPVSLPLVNYCEHGVAGMFSPKITPVFFGLTMPKTHLQPEEVEYYKKHEPVGCRDEQAYNTMTRYGIDAYLGGCLTVTLPKRKKNLERQNKVFIVDIPPNMKRYIPAEISKNAIWDTHIYLDYMEDPTAKARMQYTKYLEEASLIITGMLHAAVPCMAYGIPVVLGRDILSYRFGWLEALLPIYTEKNYKNINWNPEAVSMEQHKALVKSLFKKRMLRQNAYNEIAQVHAFYMNRNHEPYVNDVFMEIQQFIDETWLDHEAPYEYAVWGLTQMAELTVNYISSHYPNARLTHVYDKRSGLILCGIHAISPDHIEQHAEETVFVTTVSAAEYAENFFKRIGKDKSKYKTLRIIR